MSMHILSLYVCLNYNINVNTHKLLYTCDGQVDGLQLGFQLTTGPLCRLISIVPMWATPLYGCHVSAYTAGIKKNTSNYTTHTGTGISC